MSLILENVTWLDSEAIATVSMNAFYEDRMQQSFFPGISKESRINDIIARWSRNYGDLSKHYKKVVDSKTGAIVSYAIWTFAFTEAGGTLRKPHDIPHGTPSGPPTTPEGLNDPFAVMFSEKLVAMRNLHVGERPQLQLKMIGTIPKYRNQGAASIHLQWGTQIADKYNLVCWLEASPMSVTLYEKYGFKTVGTVIVDLEESCGGGQYVHSCMIREPNSAI